MPDIYEKCWQDLRKEMIKYGEEHGGYGPDSDRYCVAISIYDLVNKMDKIEAKNSKK